MNEILELKSGQVAFIAGLMAGFSLSIAAQIIRSNAKGPVANTAFVMFTTSSLLFLIALYTDVALSLRVVGVEQYSPALIEKVTSIRLVGTSAATSALFLFVTSIGIIGWLQSKWSGIITSTIAIGAVVVIWLLRQMIFDLG